MAISGSLRDVSVNDVMQFIHLGRRSGTLMLTRGEERAVLGFHRGQLVSALAPGTPKIGEILVASGRVDRETLRRAVELQDHDLERRSLGHILIAGGVIAGEELRGVIERQIEQAVAEVIGWESGAFDFALDDLRPIDDIALHPSEVLPEVDLNTQMVLLEAARIFDERDRRPAPAPAAGAAPGSGPGSGPSSGPGSGDAPPDLLAELRTRGDEAAPAAPLELQVVSADESFCRQLELALAGRLEAVRRVDLERAGAAAPGGPPAILLVDARRDAVPLDAVAALRHDRPGVPLVVVVDPDRPLGSVYATGALAALPPEVDAVVACLDSLLAARAELPGAREEAAAGVARLRRVLGELRYGLVTATVALNLMRVVSESFERAVLFLVKRDHLAVQGAFGAAADERPLAERLRGLRLPLDDDNTLTRSVRLGEAQTTDFAVAPLPEPFRSLIGPPRAGQLVVFPVPGAQRVIATIYADNGESATPVPSLEVLELAAAQVGIALENELLRRQAAGRE